MKFTYGFFALVFMCVIYSCCVAPYKFIATENGVFRCNKYTGCVEYKHMNNMHRY